MRFMVEPITVKRMVSTEICHVSDGIIHALSANSVGVLPVTWRKAWENAGTLA